MKDESLGETLRERRQLLNTSLEELAEKTGLPVKYLRRIEEGQWQKLPSAVYTKGFLRKYAAAVGTNPDEIIRRYEALRPPAPPTPPVPEKNFRALIGQAAGKIRLSPRAVKIGSALIVFLLVLGYIGYQLAALFIPPQLVVLTPPTEEIIVSQDSTSLKGIVEKGSALLLNNQPLSADPSGNFEKTVELLPGLNVLEIKAVSRFNRETVIIRRIIYSP